MSPQELITRLDRAARHHATPCAHGRIRWREWGEGPNVVLLHGGFGSWLHWIRNIEVLSAHYRVLAVDLPGLGDSDAAPEPVTPESMARVVAEGLGHIDRDESEDREYHLVGFSFGGLIGGHVVAALGARAATLVLVGASGLGLPRRRIELVRRNPEMSDEERRLAQIHNVSALMLHHRSNVDELALAIQAHNDDRARTKSRRMSLSDSLRRVLGVVDTNVKGIWGEHDVTATPGLRAHRRLLLELHPETDFRAIEDAGHWVQYERAGRFNEVVVEMVSR